MLIGKDGNNFNLIKMLPNRLNKSPKYYSVSGIKKLLPSALHSDDSATTNTNYKNSAPLLAHLHIECDFLSFNGQFKVFEHYYFQTCNTDRSTFLYFDKFDVSGRDNDSLNGGIWYALKIIFSIN